MAGQKSKVGVLMRNEKKLILFKDRYREKNLKKDMETKMKQIKKDKKKEENKLKWEQQRQKNINEEREKDQNLTTR